MKRFAYRLLAATLLTSPVTLGATASAQFDYDYHPGATEGIILFDRPDFQGDARVVDGAVDTLNVARFNDRARSVAVLEGAWELCKDSYFRGRCIVVREDVQELEWFGLGDEITSIRRISDYAQVEHLTLVERDDYGELTYVYDDPYHYYQSGYQSYGPTTIYSSSVFYGHGHYGPDYYGHRHFGYGYRPGWQSARGHGYRNPPPRHVGVRRGDVTIFSDPDGRGRSFGIDQDIPDFSRYRFNDIGSSLRIRSGVWEVCEHAHYRGRCEIVDASLSGLRGLRLNDNISSIRRVRPGHGGARGGPGHFRGDGTPPRGRGHRGRRDIDPVVASRPYQPGVDTRERNRIVPGARRDGRHVGATSIRPDRPARQTVESRVRRPDDAARGRRGDRSRPEGLRGGPAAKAETQRRPIARDGGDRFRRQAPPTRAQRPQPKPQPAPRAQQRPQPKPQPAPRVQQRSQPKPQAAPKPQQRRPDRAPTRFGGRDGPEKR